jgi:transposase
MELCRKCNINYAHVHMITALFFILDVYSSLKLLGKQTNLLDISNLCGIIRFTTNAAPEEVHMAKPHTSSPKEKALRESGALNTHLVRDGLFSDSDFFDPRDLVQVKYEMLRKVHKEAEPISSAAASFGFSRPSFYKSFGAFEREGVMGLLPRKRGPRSGHKLTAEVLAFARDLLAGEEPMGIPALLDEVEKQFGIRVHRRSLERAIRSPGKKTVQIPGNKREEVP